MSPKKSSSSSASPYCCHQSVSKYPNERQIAQQVDVYHRHTAPFNGSIGGHGGNRRKDGVYCLVLCVCVSMCQWVEWNKRTAREFGTKKRQKEKEREERKEGRKKGREKYNGLCREKSHRTVGERKEERQE
mmetsp:Transcript_40898/g.46239  ORF Transcript_40898/g.46239 Transcript_40898/m.46239 type:complete len:131 (+) Transcript_40898:231-623(+)